MATSLGLPSFYVPGNAGKWDYGPNKAVLKTIAPFHRKQFGLKSRDANAARVALLLIDMQRDFCIKKGSLYVGGRSGMGAIHDSQRIAQFIYRNMDVLKNIFATMDSHSVKQIFFPDFWQDEEGNSLNPFDVIDSKLSILRQGREVGVAKLNPFVTPMVCDKGCDWLEKQVRFYCEQLKSVTIWPYHCLFGTEGHKLVGVVEEAIFFHSMVTGNQHEYRLKGNNPLTECYSAFNPELLTAFDGTPLAVQDYYLMNVLLNYDVIIVAGEAMSHCVLSSVNDIHREIQKRNPELAKKVYLMVDGTSAVTVPDGNGGFFVDHTDAAVAAFDRFSAAGMNLVKSTDPIRSWPNMPDLDGKIR